MKMTTKMIMLQNIEKMVMEQQRVDENDSYIRQDTSKQGGLPGFGLFDDR